MMRRYVVALVATTIVLCAPTFPLGVADEGAVVSYNRPTLNFTGAGVACADNAGSNRWDCTIGGGGGGGDAVGVEDGDNAGTFTATTDADFEDSGDINFVLDIAPAPDQVSAQIRAGAVGTAEAAALDTGDTTSGTFADARIDGSLEEDEIDLLDLRDAAAAGACTGLQVVRRNAGDAAWECATPTAFAGGSVEVDVDFAAIGNTNASTVVTGQAWVAAGSEIACAPTMLATSSRAEGAEDAIVEGLTVAIHTKVVGTGFTVSAAAALGRAIGVYKFHCVGV